MNKTVTLTFCLFAILLPVMGSAQTDSDYSNLLQFLKGDGAFENAYLRSSIDRFQAAVTNDFNNGIALPDAIEQRKSLLAKNTYTYLEPEHINSFESVIKDYSYKKN